MGGILLMAETSQRIFKSWTEIKTFVTAPKELDLQYHEFLNYYLIFVVEAGVEYFTEIWKNTSVVEGIDVSQNNLDLTDFEDNYKVNANQAIDENVTVENEISVVGAVQAGDAITHDKLDTIIEELGLETGSSILSELQSIDDTDKSILDTIGQESGETVLGKLQNIYDKEVELFETGIGRLKLWDGFNEVDVVTDSGDYNRLAVDVGGQQITVSSDDSPTKYQLQTDYNIVGEALNTSTDVVLFSYTGSGLIDLIAVNSSVSSNWEIVIEIDNTERLRIQMNDLGSTLGLTSPQYSIVASTANKEFRFHPKNIGFVSGFRVLAKATTGTPSVTHLIMYREKTG